MADNDTKSVVISIRGSWSMRDILTDLTATWEQFEAIDFPTDSFAHGGEKCLWTFCKFGN